MRWKEAMRWILRNTVVSNDSLTPQFRLRLITETCPLWMSTPDKCPLPDPYWAFYWPGGQAVTKYIADRGDLFRNSVVVDVGCGCGSASIAAVERGATVIANDIDQNALLATKLNFRLNKIRDEQVFYTDKNLLDTQNDKFFLQNIKKSAKIYIILGDMFYDSDFALSIFNWLGRYINLFTKRQLEEYSLPGYVIKEHFGFNVAGVYEICMSATR